MKKFIIKHSASVTATIFSLFSIFLYYFLTKDFQRMWHGTQGDELFITAFFNRVINGQYFSDFYTGWLPPFYPPLYFWFTGTIAKFFASNGVTAAKVGVMITFAIWFLGSYLWQRLGWRVVGNRELVAGSEVTIEEGHSKIGIEKSPVFFLFFPFLFFLLLDYADIITKPYEALTAFFSVIFLGLFSAFLQTTNYSLPTKNYLSPKTYNLKPLLFFGLSGALLFLTYYFWWFILIPALFIIALTQKRNLVLSSLFLVLSIGAIITLIAAPYLIPLFASYIKFGMENWQPLHFVYGDLKPYLPWLQFSIPGLFYTIGLATMVIQRKNKFIQSNILILSLCYLYYFINVIIFFTGNTPWQTSKPFYFLGGAALLASASYGLISLVKSLPPRIGGIKGGILATIAIMLLGQISNSLILSRPSELAYQASAAQLLATDIRSSVPDAENRIWLSSGYPELNAYVNLNYFVAHNAHFSHPASHFSQRLERIRELADLADLGSADEFSKGLTKLDPPVNALLLYYSLPTTTYKLFFRIDDFGNGSKEIQFDLNPELLANFKKVYDKNGWTIWLPK